MSDLKNEWKKTGKGLGYAFRDLGKTLVKTAKTGADKADQWANAEDEPPATDRSERDKDR